MGWWLPFTAAGAADSIDIPLDGVETIDSPQSGRPELLPVVE